MLDKQDLEQNLRLLPPAPKRDLIKELDTLLALLQEQNAPPQSVVGCTILIVSALREILTKLNTERMPRIDYTVHDFFTPDDHLADIIAGMDSNSE